MQKTHLLAAATIAASLGVSACNSEPELVTVNKFDPMAEQLENAAPVTELPASISHSRTYRCADNSLIYVDFYTNNTARLRTVRGGDAVTLTAEGGNPPYQAEGHSISANADTAQISVPGRGSQSCHT